FDAAFPAQENDTCSLPKKVGPCRASVPRYYFDATTGKCEPFTYGGCEGNANNFHTLKQCQRTCKAPALGRSLSEEPDFDEACTPTADQGPCKAYMPRWFFNVDTGACERFIYGGCGGNANNYRSFEECERTCLRRSGRAADCT
ncbi:unnamed protein product, partial [Ixodes hexagonus]